MDELTVPRYGAPVESVDNESLASVEDQLQSETALTRKQKRNIALNERRKAKRRTAAVQRTTVIGENVDAVEADDKPPVPDDEYLM